MLKHVLARNFEESLKLEIPALGILARAFFVVIRHYLEGPWRTAAACHGYHEEVTSKVMTTNSYEAKCLPSWG